MEPASLTKLMTELVAFAELDAGRIALTDEGRVWSNELFRGILGHLDSGNDREESA